METSTTTSTTEGDFVRRRTELPPLLPDGSNFEDWELQVRFYLLVVDLWDVEREQPQPLPESVTKPDKARVQAVAHLHRSLPPLLAAQVRESSKKFDLLSIFAYVVRHHNRSASVLSERQSGRCQNRRSPSGSAQSHGSRVQ
jgi:hypothetical protein